MIKGKVVLIPFPFDDLSSTKVRPAVCLTNSIGKYNHILLALITSQIPMDLLETNIVLDTSHPDFAASGLHKPSTIRLDHLMTVRKSLVRREAGRWFHEGEEEGWGWIVSILLPSGWTDWHIPDQELELFEHLPVISRQWENYTTEEKYFRVLAARFEAT